MDLRLGNGRDPNILYTPFWEAIKEWMVEVCDEADERRHGDEHHLPQAMSVPDLVGQIKRRLMNKHGVASEEDLEKLDIYIPTERWVAMQFTHSRPDTHAGLKYTGMLKLRFTIQKRQFSKAHPDAHYARATLKYQRGMSILYRQHVTFISIDDKHKIAVGDADGYPLETGVRPHGRGITTTTGDINTGDHNFPKCSLTPSGALVIDIPDNIDESFYSGTLFLGLKDTALEASSAERHAVELVQVIRSRGPVSPMLFITSDGGPDCNITHPRTKLVYILLFFALDLDVLIVCRPAPNGVGYIIHYDTNCFCAACD